MIKDTMTIRFNTSNSPWITKYEEVTFSRNKLQHIVDEIVQSCNNKNYSAAHSYNKHITDVIYKEKANIGSRRPLMLALKNMLSEQSPEGVLPWSNPYVAAIRSLDQLIAYATPGFIEARAYNEIYGV